MLCGLKRMGWTQNGYSAKAQGTVISYYFFFNHRMQQYPLRHFRKKKKKTYWNCKVGKVSGLTQNFSCQYGADKADWIDGCDL